MRLATVLFKILSKIQNEIVNGACGGIYIIAPNRLKDFFTGHHFILVFDQQFQQQREQQRRRVLEQQREDPDQRVHADLGEQPGKRRADRRRGRVIRRRQPEEQREQPRLGAERDQKEDREYGIHARRADARPHARELGHCALGVDDVLEHRVAEHGVEFTVGERDQLEYSKARIAEGRTAPMVLEQILGEVGA